MTAIVCMSDTHQQHRKIAVPEGDIVVHAGDMTFVGHIDWLRDFANWYASLPHKHKVLIAGNHDLTLESFPELGRIFLDKGIVYLNEESAVLEGLKFFGTPWSLEFNDWAFNVPRGGEARQRWAKIPDDTDVLVVHGPPYMHGDLCRDGRRVGCPDLLERIHRIRPQLVVCGHIHESAGVYTTAHGSVIINASALDEQYRLVNAPHVWTTR